MKRRFLRPNLHTNLHNSTVGSIRAGGDPEMSDGALSPPGGDLTIPCYVVRPGSIEALSDLGESMFMWATIQSINGNGYKPCFASDATLGQTIARSRETVRSRIADLRSVPGLLFEVRRPRGGSVRIPTVFRWATDPFARNVWNHLISRVRLPEIAEQYGLGGDWLLNTTKHLSIHAARAQELGDRIKVDLLTAPGPESRQYGRGAVGRGQRKKPYRPRRRVKFGNEKKRRSPKRSNVD